MSWSSRKAKLGMFIVIVLQQPGIGEGWNHGLVADIIAVVTEGGGVVAATTLEVSTVS